MVSGNKIDENGHSTRCGQQCAKQYWCATADRLRRGGCSAQLKNHTKSPMVDDLYKRYIYKSFTSGTRNKCSLLKCALLFLFLPILIVIVLFISIAVSITTCKECLVRKKRLALYQWLILPLALFTVIVPSVVVSCVVCIVVLFRCLLRMVPVQADMIMENVYQWTNIIWKCICCISSTKTGSNQSILPK